MTEVGGRNPEPRTESHTFARRFATYKRADLILNDLSNAARFSARRMVKEYVARYDDKIIQSSGFTTT